MEIRVTVVDPVLVLRLRRLFDAEWESRDCGFAELAVGERRHMPVSSNGS